MTVYNNLIDTSLPDGGDDPAEADNNMRRVQKGFQEILAVEHNVDFSGTVITGDGKHTDITTLSIVNAGALANAGNLTINTDKFTIDAATGNVVVAGTLGVAGIATLGDGSKMATSAAPGADAELANKKYVDDQDTADHPAYSGGESHIDGSGLIHKMGKDITHTGDHGGGVLKATVTFGTPFPNALIAVIATVCDEAEYGGVVVSIHDASASLFDYALRESVAGTQNMSGVYWHAIGY